MPSQVTITPPWAKTKMVGRQPSLDLISASRNSIRLNLCRASFELKTTLNAVTMYLGWKQQSNLARGCITSLPVLSLGSPFLLFLKPLTIIPVVSDHKREMTTICDSHKGVSVYMSSRSQRWDDLICLWDITRLQEWWKVTECRRVMQNLSLLGTRPIMFSYEY